MGQRTVKIWVKTVAIVALAIGLGTGCTRRNTDAPTEVQNAESVDPLTAYARSVLDIEPIRQQAYEKIVAETAESSQPPAVVCSDRDTILPLRGEVKKIAVEYCNQAKEIAQENGIDASQFNKIAQQLESDPMLKEAIKAELLKLQQPNGR